MSIFWGKLKQNQAAGVTERLDLTHHCTDVALVFRLLCEQPAIRRTLQHATGHHLTSRQLDRIGVFAFLHDLGKCNWGFQAKQDAQARSTAGHVKETLPLFFDPDLAENLGQILETDRLIQWVDGPEAVFHLFAAAISHHGRPAFTFEDGTGLDCQTAIKYWKSHNGLNPMDGLRELAETVRDVFPAAFEDAVAPFAVTIPFQHHFAGLVMLADWLGSHSEAFFPFEHQGNRIEWSRLRAQQALTSVGLNVARWFTPLAQQPLVFADIFGFQPYPLQERLAAANLPLLLIAESDTGSGKTEAALFHFLTLFAAGEVESLYFALPTRVAARELYERILKTVRQTFGDTHPPVLLAVPGYAQVDGEPAFALPSETRLLAETEAYRSARRWSAERPKRFLAATVAVGTIDQALLSAIRVGHAHLRRICLDRALLVIDEVHSSDVYMRALSRQMLADHLAAGGRALLLSATLGAAARQEYLQLDGFAAVEPFETAVEQPYPALSAAGSVMARVSAAGLRAKRVHIEPLAVMETLNALLPRLEQAVSEGLRVLVVLNTVQRAMQLFSLAEASAELTRALFTFNGVACPHHGRFAKSDREALDKAVTHRLGKHSPAGALLLIGTQTLEQSLDIDADWLVTDLAPIDVLLQRIGRLHRHDRGHRAPPVCTVLLPEVADFSSFIRAGGDARFGTPAGMGSVYEDLRILQLTRDLVAAAPVFDLPRHNRRLIETATHPESLAALSCDRWEKHSQHIEGKIQAMLMAADGAVIPAQPFGAFTFPSSLDTRLMTRLGLDSRCLSLGEPCPGPFGLPVRELDIPGHLAPGLNQETADKVQSTAEGLIIEAGQHIYRYSRMGLERINESAYR